MSKCVPKLFERNEVDEGLLQYFCTSDFFLASINPIIQKKIERVHLRRH